MKKKFNIGDIIILTSGIGKFCNDELHRPQVVLDNMGRYGYITRFMDTGCKNNFAFECSYLDNCILLSEWGGKYSNGVPVNWEGVL